MTQKKEDTAKTVPEQKKKLISDRAAAMLKKIEAELAQEAETGTVPFRAKAVEQVMLSMRPITEPPKKEKEPKKP